MGCKSPVGRPPSTMLTLTTSPRQGPSREGRSEGSRRQSCEPRDTNAIENRHPRGESAQHGKAPWPVGHGKWRGCAATVHALIRGDLPQGRPDATGTGLRPRTKDLEAPPDPISPPRWGEWASLNPLAAVMTAISRKSYWHMSKTLATQTGMTNEWLARQGLLSIRDLWLKAHGYA